jgi:hypothetical protein
MEKIENGQVYCKLPPRCPVHGAMRMSREVPPPQVLWTCHGWDGEGCGHSVRGEDIPWQHIGDVKSWTLRMAQDPYDRLRQAERDRRAGSS